MASCDVSLTIDSVIQFKYNGLVCDDDGNIDLTGATIKGTAVIDEKNNSLDVDIVGTPDPDQVNNKGKYTFEISDSNRDKIFKLAKKTSITGEIKIYYVAGGGDTLADLIIDLKVSRKNSAKTA
jgi:hypothetical protein